MKTLKKLFSVSAIVALLGTLAPMYAFGATYTDELEDAYAYARANGVTTKNTIDEADMYGSLTRIAMAKMIANYATTVLGLEADTSRNCTFSDVTAALDAEYGNGVTNACQLGLMGIDDNGNVKATFDPKGTVTRAQFATALSRAISQAEDGEAIANGNPYYRTHIAYLNGKGIVKSEAEYDVNSVEKRGYVMLMMMRADKNYTPSEGCTTEQIVACALEDDTAACLAACSGNEEPEEPEIVKNGTLTITTKDYSSDVVSAPKAGIIVFNAIKFAASEEITVDTLTLSTIGLTDRSDVKKVWFEKDGVKVSSKASITSDGTATVNFTKGLTIKSSETLDLVAELDADAGAEVAFKIDSVSSTAKKVEINSKTTTYRTTTYSVAGLTFTLTDSSNEYKLGEQTELTLGQFKLANNSDAKTVNVKSITFDSKNSDIEKVLKNFRLVKDGENVVKSVSFDGKKVTLALDDSLESSKNATYTLYAEVKELEDGEEEFHFDLAGTEYLVADENDTNFRASITDDTANDTDEWEVVITGGKIIFSNDGSFSTAVNANAGYSDVQIAQGTLTLAEPVMFNKLTFDDNAGDGSDYFAGVKSLKLEIGGKTYNATIETGVDGNTYTFEDIYVNKTSSVKMYVNFANTVEFTTLTIAGGNLSNSMFTEGGEYTNNSSSFDNGAIAGTVKVAKITVKDSKFTLKNQASSTVRVVKGESDSVILFSGYATSKDEIQMNTIKIDNVSLAGTDSIDLTLKVAGKTVATKTYKNGTAELVYNVGNVKVNSDPVAIVLEAIPHVTATTTAPHHVFKLSAEGTFNGNVAKASPVNAATLQIVDEASMTVSNSSAASKAVIEGSNVELTTFTINVKDGSTILNDVVFDGDMSELTDGQAVSLEIDGDIFEGVVDGTADQIIIEDMEKHLTAGSYTATLTTDVLTDGVLNGVYVEIDTVTLNAGAATDLDLVYYFVKAYPTITKKSAENNQLTVTIKNTSTTHDMKITTADISVANGTVMSLNGQISPSYVATLAPGESVDAVISVDVDLTAALQSVQYQIVDNAETYTYDVWYDLTNVAEWGTLQLTYSS